MIAQSAVAAMVKAWPAFMTHSHAGGTLVRHRDGEPALISHRLRLRVVSGPDAGAERSLDGAQLVVGSEEGADLTLSDRSVSRRHCEIVVDGERYVVRDLESTNGTFIGDVRVTEAPLAPGMQLRVGDSVLAFEPKKKWVRLSSSEHESFGPMLGVSGTMREVFGVLERIAATRLSCVLAGETGTGKELAARGLHDKSERASGPFVVVDCGAISPTLFESELFGHEKGAFTGADRAREGAFELATGGTLFLDEVGDLPLDLQPRLLRALERREVRRLGASRMTSVDVRVVSATHRALDEMVEAGTFRKDLYFRLAEVTVELPPLRERTEDIAVIARHLLELEGGRGRRFADSALAVLAKHAWPGNVRELRNVVRRAAALGSGPEIGEEALGLGARSGPVEPEASLGSNPALLDLPLKQAREASTSEFERRYVRALLERHGWDFESAARAAGVHPKSLQRLAREHGITR